MPNSPARDRLLPIILLTAGALSAAACCRVAGPCDRTAEAELAAGGTYTVNVHDERGRLDGVEIDPAGVSATETVSNPSDQPNVLLVTWEGSACDRQTDVGIAGDGSSLEVVIDTTVAPVECDAIGVRHLVRLTSTEPLPAATVRVRVEQPTAG